MFANGTLLGPAQVARHMRGQVSAHELSWAANKHATCAKIDAASVDVINEFAKLDVAGVWGTGHVAGTDGSQIGTWGNNILAESHIRYGGYGGLAMRHISDTYVALFSHFIPCGVWEAVYIIKDCCGTSPISSRIRFMPIRKASRCRCSGSRHCWGSTCYPGSATGPS